MKTKKYWLVLPAAFLILLNISFKDTPDCTKLKNGKFYYYNKLSKLKPKVIIERFDSLQIETNTENGRVLRNKIVWRNSCSFDMYINSLSKTKLNTSDSLFSTVPATVNIIYVTNDFYIYSAKMNILNKTIELSDTIYIMK